VFFRKEMTDRRLHDDPGPLLRSVTGQVPPGERGRAAWGCGSWSGSRLAGVNWARRCGVGQAAAGRPGRAGGAR